MSGSYCDGLSTAAFGLSGTQISLTPFMYMKALAWPVHQDSQFSDQKASAYVKLEAPNAATKMCACTTSPVTGSVTGRVEPAKSENSFFPASWVCRMTTSMVFAHVRYIAQKWEY